MTTSLLRLKNASKYASEATRHDLGRQFRQCGQAIPASLRLSEVAVHSNHKSCYSMTPLLFLFLIVNAWLAVGQATESSSASSAAATTGGVDTQGGGTTTTTDSKDVHLWPIIIMPLIAGSGVLFFIVLDVVWKMRFMDARSSTDTKMRKILRVVEKIEKKPDEAKFLQKLHLRKKGKTDAPNATEKTDGPHPEQAAKSTS
ncbi:hypothetical protein EMMF5_004246 [Cystobasidiomycetes sp. EMM_F5]